MWQHGGITYSIVGDLAPDELLASGDERSIIVSLHPGAAQCLPLTIGGGCYTLPLCPHVRMSYALRPAWYPSVFSNHVPYQ